MKLNLSYTNSQIYISEIVSMLIQQYLNKIFSTPTKWTFSTPAKIDLESFYIDADKQQQKFIQGEEAVITIFNEILGSTEYIIKFQLGTTKPSEIILEMR